MASKLVISLACVLVTCCVWQGSATENESLQDVIHTVSVDKMILPKILPKSQKLENYTENLWKAIVDILEYEDFLTTIESLNESSPEVVEQYQLDALKILLLEVKDEACIWLNDVIEGGFGCTTAEFANLRTKFDLYEDLKTTEAALEDYVNNETPSCQK